MRKKFKILYPQDHEDADKRGEPYKPPKDSFIVMSGDGVFFQMCNTSYYPSITKLSNVLEKYDVIWRG